VQEGSVRYTDLEGEDRRDVRVEAGDSLAIAPGIAHQVEPSTDARFFVQFHRELGDPLVPGRAARPDAVLRSDSRAHRGRDLDDSDELFELVTRQYVEISEDPVLEPYFAFAGPLTDWYSHVLAGTEFWSRTLFEPPNREVDAVLERFRRRHEQVPFTPAAFDRWLELFHTTIDDGWTGPNADHLKKRAIGMAWAAASRTLGKGVWDAAAHR
jgi:truncated hemoglobin YjbI